MYNTPTRAFVRRTGLVLSVILTPLILISAILIGLHDQALASSHREAPLIAKDTAADNTDAYVWMSKDKNVVLAAMWIPFESPEGAPNYWEWDNSALYDIYVDNNGDATADFTYTLSSKTKVSDPTSFLYNLGTIKADGTNWNSKQYYTVTETSKNGTVVLVSNKLAAPSNIGEKSTPDYATLEQNGISTAPGGIKVFAGQSDDPFWVDLQFFDLLTVRGLDGTTPLVPGSFPLGYKSNNIPVDSVSGYNVHSLILEIPPSRLVNGDPVLGVWSATRRASTRVIQALNVISNSTDFVQVSRLGMPLVNEVVIPLALKDAFNSLPPNQDAVLYTYAGADPFLQTVQSLLQKSVEDPEIGTRLCQIYGMPLPGEDPANKCHTKYTAGTPGPLANSGRADIFDIFLRGMVLARPFTINTANGPVTLPAGRNINRPSNPDFAAFGGVLPAEMMRINTTISGTLCSPTPHRLGVLGADACGFPNGRRLSDEVVEIELLAVAGAVYPLLTNKDYTVPQAYVDVLTRGDGIDTNDVGFRTTFPYVQIAQSGQAHWHTNPFYTMLAPWIQN